MKEIFEKTKKLDICFACDEAYSKYTYIAAYSILKHKREDWFYIIHILTDKSLSPISLERFQSLETVFPGVKIHTIILGEEFADCSVEEHLAVPTYYRLLLADLLKDVDYCFYLDSDTIACGDIAQVLDYISNSNQILYGVKQIGNRLMPDGGKEFCETWGIPDIENYINAGVLLMNLRMIRENDYTKLFLKMANEKEKIWPGADQFILNCICYDSIGFLPYKFNMGTTYVFQKKLLQKIFDSHEIEDAYFEPVIIHYAEKKPWRDTHVPYAEKWWNIVKETEYYEEYTNDYLEYSLKPAFHKYPPFREFTDLLEYCRGQCIVIYGAGDFGRRTLACLRQKGIEPFCFAVSDANNAKECNCIEGIEVYSLESLIPYREMICVLIASDLYAEEMDVTLDQLHFKKKHRIFKEYFF